MCLSLPRGAKREDDYVNGRDGITVLDNGRKELMGLLMPAERCQH